MKNYTNRLFVALLFVALLFVCLSQSVNAQNHMVNNNSDQIFVDTLGKYAEHYKPQNIKNKTGKIEPTAFGELGKLVEKGWDAIFENDRPKVVYNAFNIGVDTVFEKDLPVSPALLSMKNRNIPPSPKGEFQPAPVFSEKKQEMTVKFENGRFVPIAPQTDSIEKVGKGIVESTFNMNVIDPDEIDTDFLKTDSFVYQGEIYHKMTKAELEGEEYQKPRVKKRFLLNDKSDKSDNDVKKAPKISSNEDFVDMYEDAADDGERYGVPSAITMAQGILESRGGRSRMAVALNNLFGIKCNGGRCKKSGCQHGYFDDDRESETFEKHASYEASFNRHVQFFLNNDRYEKCLSCGVQNVECWLYRLQRSGYATDKMYDYKLAEIINRYKLTDKPIHYDRKRVAERLNK